MLMIPADSMMAILQSLLQGPWTARELAAELERPLRTTQSWLECLDVLGCPVERVPGRVPSYRLRWAVTANWLLGPKRPPI